MRHFDPAALPEMMESFCAKNYSALLKAPPPGCTLHMVRGLASSVWLGDGEIEVSKQWERGMVMVFGGMENVAWKGGGLGWAGDSTRLPASSNADPTLPPTTPTVFAAGADPTTAGGGRRGVGA